MKRFLLLIPCFCIVFLLFGCSSSPYNLDREVSHDKLSWKVPSNWRESAYPSADVSFPVNISFVDAEKEKDDANSAPTIIFQFRDPQKTLSPEYLMNERKSEIEQQENWELISWDDENLGETVKDGVTISKWDYSYSHKYVNADNPVEESGYVAYIQKPGSINVNLLVYNSDEKLLDAVINSLTFS